MENSLKKWFTKNKCTKLKTDILDLDEFDINKSKK